MRVGLTTSVCTAGRCLGVVWAVLISACDAPREEHLGLLDVEAIRVGEATPDAVHVYRLEAEDGEEVRIEVDQGAVDVGVRVVDPEGKFLFTYDTFVGTLAPESFCFSAASLGTYSLEVETWGETGRYRIKRANAVGEPGQCTAATAAFIAAQELSRTNPTAKAKSLEQAADLWGRAGEFANSAMAWRDAGSTWWDLDRGKDAVRCFRAGQKQLERASSSYLDSSLHNRLAVALLERGDLPAAREILEEAWGRAQQKKETYGEAILLLSLGQVDEQEGDTHRAIRRYRRALSLLRPLDFPGDQARAFLALAEAYGLLDRHQESLDALDEAEPLALATGDRLLESDVASARAWTLHLRGDPDLGVPYLRRALALRVEKGDLNRIGSARNRLATLLRRSGDFARAEVELRNAITQAETRDNPYDLAAHLVSLGCLHQRQGRLEEAIQALVRGRPLLGDVEDPKTRSQLAYCEALIARDQGDLHLALDKVQAALEIVDQLRDVARPQGHRYRPIWLWQDFAQLRADLLVALHRQTGESHFLEEAFVASDADRSRNLFEMVVESRLELDGIPQELLARQEQIQQSLNRLGTRIQRLSASSVEASSRRAAEGSRKDGGASGELARQIRKLSVELEEVQAEIRATDEGFSQLVRPSPVALSTLRRHLEPGTVLLSYDLGPERSHLFALTQEELTVFGLAPEKELENYVEAFYNALVESAGSELPEEEEQWRFLAARLGELLVPAGAVPKGSRRILVAGEGLLHYLPFAVLANDSGLFVEQYELATIPSASVFVALKERRARRRPAPNAAAIFANPTYAESAEATGRDLDLRPGLAARRGLGAERLPEGGLPPLPFTAQEAASIATRLPGPAFLAMGHEATKEAVLDTDLRTYRFVHFATHARIDEEFPELSSLILATVDPVGRPLDGELRLHEIFRLRLQADLTVLSGCQTALGRRVRGDGLLGFTRGFLYAGSSRVIVSLWSVDDEATSHLMTAFYKALLEDGEPPAAALRTAQRFLREESPWKAPYYWAPFVIQGDF